jgi:glyoxylase-like metal-dependent hydrolase (beta-lactamase superfamily II)
MANSNTTSDRSEPTIHSIFETVTGTWQYVVADAQSKQAVIIDSVLDFDPASSMLSTKAADQVLHLVLENGYTVTHILETHAHADHLTAARYLQSQLTPTPLVGIGKRISKVQETFGERYSIPKGELVSAFDIAFADDEEFMLGSLRAKVLHLPGHTPDHIGYQIGSNVFTGDSIFNPDVGSARCDFPGGSAADLYTSTQRLLGLPDHFKLYTGHDYPPEGREAKPYFLVADQREKNKHVGGGKTEDEFVVWRSERDRQLGEPRLLHWAMQVNIRGGRLPRRDADGLIMFKVPVKGLETAKGLM